MKKLILLRHAKSSWDYPELQDIDRPLNKRGRKDAPKMGKWLRQNGIVPDLILCSPSVRTLATISRVGMEMGLRGKDYHIEPSLYHASVASILQLIHSVPDNINSLLLVGHNPGLTEFANRMCPAESTDNIPTCGVYAMQLSCEKWREAQQPLAEFLFFQYPKNLKN